MAKSLVLFSGGLDSTVLLYKAMYKTQVQVVMFGEYSQLNSRSELEAAYMVWNKLLETNPAMQIASDFLISAFVINTRSAMFGDNIHGSDLPVYNVPSRNLTLLSLAAATAFGARIYNIFIGCTAEDVEFPDCNPLFFRLAEEAINAGLGLHNARERIHIHTPFVHKSKAEVIELGLAMGVPFELTWSCYKSNRRPCLKCPACVTRTQGFMSAGFSDPALTDAEWGQAIEEVDGWIPY